MTEHQVLCLPSSEIIIEVSRGIEIQAKWESGTAVPSTTATFSMTFLIFFFFFNGECKFQGENAASREKGMIQHTGGRQIERQIIGGKSGVAALADRGWNIYFFALNQSNFFQFETNTMS